MSWLNCRPKKDSRTNKNSDEKLLHMSKSMSISNEKST